MRKIRSQDGPFSAAGSTKGKSIAEQILQLLCFECTCMDLHAVHAVHVSTCVYRCACDCVSLHACTCLHGRMGTCYCACRAVKSASYDSLLTQAKRKQQD